MNTTRGLLLITIAVGSAACGSDENVARHDAAPPVEPDAATPYGAIALADLPGTLQDAVCGFEVRCGLMPDATTCAAVFDPATTDVAQLAAYATAGRLTYDPIKAGVCLTAYRDAACAWTAGGLGPAAVCDEVFTGDKVAGVSCFLDEECTGAMICETTACVGGCCAGTCKAPAAPVAIGGDCLAGPCADGAFCRLDGTGAATCTAVAVAGAICTAVDGCAADSVCDLDPAAGQGTCVALAAAGAACDPSVGVGSCAGIDRWCDPSSTCQPRKAAGDACGGDGECIEAAACVAGSCVVRPKPGEACGPAVAGGGCLGDLPCVGGLCTTDSIEAVCP